jgi:UDP-N-acetylmuramoylalanine--D-glutamate ligase
MIVSPVFANRKYALLGLARSGLAAARSLAASGAQVFAWDANEIARAKVADIATLVDPMTIDFAGLDAVVVTPGVPLNKHPIAKKARDAGVPIIGDIELFALARETMPPCRVVGITGTNGKSTTTALVDHILKNAALQVRMGGNIGLPILAQRPMSAGGVYVLELSSYQIDLTHNLACDVAALINLSPDHLDRYDGYQGYVDSKARIFAMQKMKQHAVFGSGDADTHRIYQEVMRYKPGGYCHLASTKNLSGQLNWPSLQGPHNLQNVAVAISIVEALGLQERQWRPALATFRGLEHRMEIVAEHMGILFVNDSKATNPASTAPALAAYPRVRWILGGLPKGDNLDECAPNYGHVVKAYTIGEAGLKFARQLAPVMPVEQCELLITAVAKAANEAVPGDVILLSPACASFDQFKDFEARGDCFKAAVASWIGSNPV